MPHLPHFEQIMHFPEVFGHIYPLFSYLSSNTNSEHVINKWNPAIFDKNARKKIYIKD